MRLALKQELLTLGLALTLAAPLPGFAAGTTTPEKRFETPVGIALSVKQIGPVTQTTDLQIICVLKHDPAGDQYIEAMQDFNDKQGGLLSSLRERGEFVGELGETFLYTPPPRSITPKRVLLIGIGEAKELSLDRLRLVGRIALREAVRLGVKHVSFAPTLRDQGSSVIDVGEGDAAVVEQMLLAYDTEKRLQQQGLAPKLRLSSWVIEAGPKYFEGVNTHVGDAIKAAGEQIQQRDSKPYVNAAPAAK
ncbi:M17 family peptidase N-terminal domain-containing protein [Stigmatella aurantiaca]|uniref:Peptidase M17 leucyl aminopeptidase domain protein n=3 Tax=Stigmatella aurantiaca (strain DW4/3-1) TaxID=378806 RepID=E3FU17_STIAD|nr:M17 family peptidase N-terminal domain-containing protein [Stigmatella aurantiaca]ADO72157.1 Peptidase M17 leucyl aminopeptidase domain protein [Stigmatella aurantiaca DW4/3-1]